VTIAFDKTLGIEEWQALLRAHPAVAQQLAAVGPAFADCPGATIEPRTPPLQGARITIADVQALRLRADPDSPTGTLGGYRLSRTLGQGGMGIVHQAEQLVLDREVAIKTLLPQHAGEARARNRLLREAWLTGRLEHPNIVPIYDLRMDEAGLPYIVMRKVAGVRWDELLGSDALVAERFGVPDVREWHLRVLLQVAQAVTRAHAARIVHRDLKPDNVMIGEYGEVYLLDWGIAVSLEQDSTGAAPNSTSGTEIAGTPCYMAPEMLGFGGAIDERTDVYLLGATLYEIVVGKPPHDGATTLELATCIMQSTPKLPVDLAPTLRQLVLKALQAEPGARFQTAQEFGRALNLYLTYRGSDSLVASADGERAQVAELLRAAPSEATRKALYAGFASANFGYQAALRSWPENAAAQAGREHLVDAFVRHELEHGNAEAAHALLRELPDPPPALRNLVERALADRQLDQQRIERLSKLEALHDPAYGRSTRRAIGMALTLAAGLAPLAIEYQTVHHANSSVDAAQIAVRAVVWLTLVVVLLFFARARIMRTAVNRNIAFAVCWGFLLPIFLLSAEVTIGIPLQFHTGLSLFSWAAVMGMTAFTVEKRFVVSALGYFIGSTIAIRYPQYRYYAASFANLPNLWVILFGWSNEEPVRASSQTRDESGKAPR
jgi:eukaryotic-like serine/threonine-protein kinase